jgi:hypothetical protein
MSLEDLPSARASRSGREMASVRARATCYWRFLTHPAKFQTHHCKKVAWYFPGLVHPAKKEVMNSAGLVRPAKKEVMNFAGLVRPAKK